MDEPRLAAGTSRRQNGVRDADRLLLMVYDELRSLARRYLDAERSYQTLQPTALVHEAYLRLVKLDRMEWKDKTHFLAMAATQMRRILVERARAASARRRGSRPRRITLDSESDLTEERRPLDLLALDEALRKLGERSARQARVAEMHVFSGMQMDEIGAFLSLSERTIKRDWRFARAWLTRELRRGIGP